MKVIAPFISCVVNLPLGDELDEFQAAVDQGFMEIYVMTPQGIIKHHKLRGENRYVRLKVESIPGLALPDMRQEINFLPAGKVPNELLLQIEAFFRKVMAVKKGDLEAMIWVMWSAAQGYFLHVPDQTISKASVRYDWDDIPDGASIIVDVHSHNTMAAFYSSTDNSDDQHGIRFSGVFGHLDKPEPMTIWRFNYRDKKYEAKLDDIFEMPHARTIEIPDEWIDNVKTTTYGYQQGYQSQRHGSGAHMSSLEHYMGYGGTHLKSRLGMNTRQDIDDEPGKPTGKGTVNGGGTDPKKANVSPTNVGEPSSIEFSPEFWFLGLGGQDESAADFAIDHAERGIINAGMGIDCNEDPVGDSMDSYLAAMVHGSMMNDRYNELTINKGSKVATSFCLINDLMAELDGEEALIEELVGDMAGLMTGEHRTKLLRSIWEILPQSEKEKIQTNGL